MPSKPTGTYANWRQLSSGASRLGPPDARVSIVMFTDYECSACRISDPVVRRVQAQYAQHVSLTVRHAPLPGHLSARPAALSAICAEAQGQFWAMDSALVRARSLAPSALWSIAKAAGVRDSARFSRCMSGPEAPARLAEDLQHGEKIGIIATPTILINDEVYIAIPDGFEKTVAARAGR